MPQTTPSEPNPTAFGDLPIQPTGSGPADEQIAYERSVIDEADEIAAPQDAEDVADSVTGRG